MCKEANEITKGGDLWSRLLNAKKSILVYGMGNGAEKLLDVCGDRGIKIDGVFCSDGFERGKIFRGFPVEGMTKTLEKFPDPVILCAFGTHEKSMLEKLEELDSRYGFFVPDLPVYTDSERVSEDIFDSAYYEKNRDNISRARELFSDEDSKKLFDLILAYKLSGRLDLLKKASTEPAPEPFEKDIRICVDAGAYRGDTVEERLKNSPSVEKIFAVEPDEKNQARIEKLYGGDSRVVLVRAAAGSEEKREVFLSGNGRGGALGRTDARAKRRLVDIRTIDSVTAGERVDFIKYDVEGAEKAALEGSAATISAHLPYLRVSAYHRTGDIFELPLLIDRLSGGRYRMYLRRNYCVPAWEMDIIAIKL